MMYSKKLVASIKANGKVLREFKDGPPPHHVSATL
jgi:hypothetical protein